MLEISLLGVSPAQHMVSSRNPLVHAPKSRVWNVWDGRVGEKSVARAPPPARLCISERAAPGCSTPGARNRKPETRNTNTNTNIKTSGRGRPLHTHSALAGQGDALFQHVDCDVGFIPGDDERRSDSYGAGTTAQE